MRTPVIGAKGPVDGGCVRFDSKRPVVEVLA